MLATPELLKESAQSRLLAAEVSRCLREIPLYRNLQTLCSINDTNRIATSFQSWPTITKEDIRHGFPGNFLGSGEDLAVLLESEILELEHTSGTSEERTALLLPQGWWGEQERRALQLNGFIAGVLSQRPQARRVTINSPVCSGDIRYHGMPTRENRIVGNTLFVSLSRYPFLWSERDLERIAAEILEWGPEFLDLDPVYGVVLAKYCERQRLNFPSVRFVLGSYEYVSVVHRSILERVFRVPVLDLYGSTETGHLLMQDETGQMRPSLETAFLEVPEVDALGIGELIVSTLTNPIMPLIRYRIGDLVQRMEGPYGTRYVLHGRKADAFWISNRDRVTTRQVDRCFDRLTGLAHYQLTQRQNGSWLLRFVPDGLGPSQDQRTELRNCLSSLLHSTHPIELQQTDMIVPEQSGKFRLGYPLKAA